MIEDELAAVRETLDWLWGELTPAETLRIAHEEPDLAEACRINHEVVCHEEHRDD